MPRLQLFPTATVFHLQPHKIVHNLIQLINQLLPALLILNQRHKVQFQLFNPKVIHILHNNLPFIDRSPVLELPVLVLIGVRVFGDKTTVNVQVIVLVLEKVLEQGKVTGETIFCQAMFVCWYSMCDLLGNDQLLNLMHGWWNLADYLRDQVLDVEPFKVLALVDL